MFHTHKISHLYLRMPPPQTLLPSCLQVDRMENDDITPLLFHLHRESTSSFSYSDATDQVEDQAIS